MGVESETKGSWILRPLSGDFNCSNLGNKIFYYHFSIQAVTRAMLIFSESFQFYRMSQRKNQIGNEHTRVTQLNSYLMMIYFINHNWKGTKGEEMKGKWWLPEGSVAVELNTHRHEKKRSRGEECLPQSQTKAAAGPHWPWYLFHHDYQSNCRYDCTMWSEIDFWELGLFDHPFLIKGWIIVCSETFSPVCFFLKCLYKLYVYVIKYI